MEIESNSFSDSSKREKQKEDQIQDDESPEDDEDGVDYDDSEHGDDSKMRRVLDSSRIYRNNTLPN